MAGNIHTEEKCPLCGAKMRDNGRNAVCCPKHKKQIAKRLRVMLQVNGQTVQRRFTDYDKARRFLNGLRFKVDEGSFDGRDYKHENPMGFANLAEKWLEIKREQVRPRSWNNLRNYTRKAIAAWGNRNVKEIGYAEIEDWLFVTLKDLSDKSKNNAKSVLHSFFDWLRRRKVLTLTQIPEFPEVSFELGFRNILDAASQQRVLDALKEISAEVNPRIWIAVKWLSTYFSIRPVELLHVKEGDIDLKDGFIVVRYTKEHRPKIVPMTEEDLELVSSLPRSFAELPFFRHFKGHGGATPGEMFGPAYLRRWWQRACEKAGVTGVDLYAGTRHSTIVALGEHFTPEQLKAASMHSTNKAFERYFRVKPDDIRNIYSFDRNGPKGEGQTKGKQILPISKKKKQ